MANIGTFGTVTFEVSSNKVQTFNNFSREGSARWVSHEVIKAKQEPEFIGPGQEQITFTVRLSIYQKVNPEVELNKLRTMRDNGNNAPLIIGTTSFGYWYIESLKETYKDFDGKGRLLTLDVDLTLMEYPRPTVPAQKPTIATSSAKTSSSNASKKNVYGIITIKATMLNCRSSPSLKGHIVKVLKKNQSYKVYGITKTDISWYNLGGGLYCSASSKYLTFKKG